MKPADWHAFLPDQCPAYISWDQYERNRGRLAANRARADAMGAVRGGPALLAGLIFCARCSCRLQVNYANGTNRALAVYECTRRRAMYGEPLCQHVPGPCLDTFVSRQVLAALEPAALELSLAAAEQVQQERDELTRIWQHRLERARYEADRAARHYYAVEPENRLVARTLERAWEEKLAAQRQLEEEYHRFLSDQPRVLLEEERTAIRRLAANIPALWEAPTTTAAERKEIIRQVVERVVVDAQGASERVLVRIDWVGGDQTQGEVIRPIARFSDLSSYPQLCERIRVLTEEGLSAQAIADQLTAEGYRPPHEGTQLGMPAVTVLQRRLGLRQGRLPPRSRDGLGPDEWWAAELGRQLGTARNTLHHWIRRGWVRARQEEGHLRRWIIWADDAEWERLQQLRHRSIPEEMHRRWAEEPGQIEMAAGQVQPRQSNAEGDQ